MKGARRRSRRIFGLAVAGGLVIWAGVEIATILVRTAETAWSLLHG